MDFLMRRMKPMEVLALTLVVLKMAVGYQCQTSVMHDTDNYGPSVSDEAVLASTPFETSLYNGMIAFNADHCVRMCCEQTECALVVFNEVEAICYMKSNEAKEWGENFKTHDAAAGRDIYIIDSRLGEPEPLELEPTKCQNKRGLAYGFTDAKDLFTLRAGLSWWYNWSPGNLKEGLLEASLSQGSEYVPMIWSGEDLTQDRLEILDWVADSSHYLLGFNEPNYKYQSNLKADEAATLWPQLLILGTEHEMELVSPAVNYCSGNCVEEDPFKWLDDFFAECTTLEDPKCGMEYLAIHTYACEVKYINKHIHRYLKYGLPIWLTEFACAFEAQEPNEAGQATLLSDATTYLEMHPDVFRYAWFTGRSSANDGVAGSDLLTETGELTDVGKVFVGKHADLQRCSLGQGRTPAPVTAPIPTPMPEPIFQPTTQPTPEPMSEPTPEPTEHPITGKPTTPEVLDVDSTAAAIRNVVITNVGGSGFYHRVTDMIPGTDLSCNPGMDSCITEEVCVSGDLAPFDEVSVAFRGPMNLYNIAWYEGTADHNLEKSSWWTPESENNLVFMNNRGGALGCAGVWSICGGNGQSFADADGEWCEEEPTHFNGKLGNDNEVNIMSLTECSSEEQCGFYREVGMRGWTGGSDGTKILVLEVDMPHCSEDECSHNRPAIWALHAQVFRTAQYGCNCRGMGGNGGCGEFDILEALIGNEYSDMLFTQVYDFKGAASPGTNKYFERPVTTKTKYAAIFRGGQDAYLQVVQLDTWDFEAVSISIDLLNTLKASSTEHHEIYGVDSMEAIDGCPSTNLSVHRDSSARTKYGSGDGLTPGYEYMGCFADSAPMAKRDMPLSTKQKFGINNPEVCASHCFKEEGSTFFGLQSGDVCWCGGMGSTGPGSYGEATNCDEPCAGHEDIICGGKKASSVYVLPVHHWHVGCYKDVQENRDMELVSETESEALTPAVCAAYCSSVQGAIFFGVQNGKACFCGDSYGKYGISTLCEVPCTGDPDQICGGVNINSVYTISNPEDRSVEPEPEPSVGIEVHVDTEGEVPGSHRGCFRDSPDDRLLTGISYKDSGNRYSFYGLEWSVECYCGGNPNGRDDYLTGATELGQAKCFMRCSGGGNGTCGGENAIDVWEI